uniref:Secreted protein n=1 Tax=Macrostomum lignano TaxID=282301 RepID=A0A1I8G410_9PLAT
MAALKFFDFAFVAMVTGMLIILSDYSAAKEATSPSVPKFRSRFGGFSGTGSYKKKLSRRRCRKYRFTGRKLVCVSYFKN